MEVNPRLPTELIEAIIPHLVPLPSTPLCLLQLDDLTTLSTCCLVSPQWRAYAQPLLWSRVLLHTTRKVIPFMKMLRIYDVAHLQRAVKELWVVAEQSHLEHFLFGEHIALQLFPSLRTLRVERFQILHDFLSFRGVPDLTSLSLSRLRVYDPEDMRLWMRRTVAEGAEERRSPIPLRHLELRNMFGCSARGNLDMITQGVIHLESLAIVEGLDMASQEYLECMQNLTKGSELPSTGSMDDVEVEARYPNSIHDEVSSRQAGIKRLSLTFSPGWGASREPYEARLSQQMNAWTYILPQCPPSLTDLTLALFTAVPWVQLLIHVLPPSITSLTLLIDQEAENPNHTEQGYRDTGLQVSRMVLHELKEDKIPNLKSMLWRDRSGAWPIGESN
ncbi:BQ2448_1575 [Microbotryum intermedium]|uniref:BQ2448_1575 protein n=1 Tax=Microbotryum intermedium TaxID=269621 RepID=A0A238FDI4_9BASI|nr:BQ2448_1575 [Microbotryum intermedium]